MLAFFLISFFCSLSHAHGIKSSERERQAVLAVFEKAISLSPDFLAVSKNRSSNTPFYKVGGHKIYLDEGFWNLTRAWLKLYIQEVEKHCSCKLDPDLMIKEAKNYTAQSFFKQKVFEPAKDIGQIFAYKTAFWSTRYGYLVALMKLSAETAETVLSTVIGLKGLHFLCRLNDFLILTTMGNIQTYSRAFFYGKKINHSRWLSFIKMVWISRQIRKSQKKAFFYINQKLVVREEALREVNKEGPKSWFHKEGHRRLWIEKLKRKTDPLFEKIAEWQKELNHTETSPKKRAALKRKIKSAEKKIEALSKISRKDFFGTRQGRFFWLLSRKGRVAHMADSHLPYKILSSKAFWPLLPAETIINKAVGSSPFSLPDLWPKEQPLTNGNKEKSLADPADFSSKGAFPVGSFADPVDLEPSSNSKDLAGEVREDKDHHHSKDFVDEIREGLVEEFLLAQEAPHEGKKQALYMLLEDIERVFDVSLPAQKRMMSALSVKLALGALFAHYLDMIFPALFKEAAFSEKVKAKRAFGRFFNLIDEFSDFLSFVSLSKSAKKIQLYKYESMEKLLAFFSYLYETQTLLKSGAPRDKIFTALKNEELKIKNLSLLKEKKTAFSLFPFKKGKAQCEKLVEIY